MSPLSKKNLRNYFPSTYLLKIIVIQILTAFLCCNMSFNFVVLFHMDIFVSKFVISCWHSERGIRNSRLSSRHFDRTSVSSASVNAGALNCARGSRPELQPSSRGLHCTSRTNPPSDSDTGHASSRGIMSNGRKLTAAGITNNVGV